MKSTLNPRVKICCISSRAEAEMAIEFGASALGFVSQMPSGPGVIEDELIEEIVKTIPPPIATYLLTCEARADKIIQQQQRFKPNTIQLVDELDISEYDKLRKELSGISLVQVVHVTGDDSIDYARQVSSHVDALLLDSGNPKLKVKELGGTGRVHNWDISKKIREEIDIPLFLAGGLNPENVRDAIESVQPFGVDLCSGVRTNGKLDESKLKSFMEQLKVKS